MTSKTSIIAIATLALMSATSVFAQTNGYVREKPRLEATSTLNAAARLKAEGGVQGTSTPRAQAAVDTRSTVAAKLMEKGLLRATTTAGLRLKVYASSTPEKTRDRVLEKRAQIESIIAAKKLVITSAMFTKIKERTDRAAENMTIAVDRLASTSAALRVRAVELSGKGVEASTTLALLTAADARLVTLRASISDLAEDATLAVASSSPKVAWKDTQDMFKETIEELHAIRGLLHDAVAALKDAVHASGSGRGASAAVSSEGDARSHMDTATASTTAAATSTTP